MSQKKKRSREEQPVAEPEPVRVLAEERAPSALVPAPAEAEAPAQDRKKARKEGGNKLPSDLMDIVAAGMRGEEMDDELGLDSNEGLGESWEELEGIRLPSDGGEEGEEGEGEDEDEDGDGLSLGNLQDDVDEDEEDLPSRNTGPVRVVALNSLTPSSSIEPKVQQFLLKHFWGKRIPRAGTEYWSEREQTRPARPFVGGRDNLPGEEDEFGDEADELNEAMVD